MSSSLGAGYFAGVYADGDDPWGFRDRWYERRKRDLTVAALLQPRYARAFEPGCAIGVLTEALAPRCDELLATDVDPTALAAARARLAAHQQVRVEQLAVPDSWPPGDHDLIVVSEIGYYLAGPDLTALATRCAASLAPGGTLLACHWRHPVGDYPTSGADVHAALGRAPGLHRLVRHEEEDLLLEVFSTDGRSVARRTGLLA